MENFLIKKKKKKKMEVKFIWIAGRRESPMHSNNFNKLCVRLSSLSISHFNNNNKEPRKNGKKYYVRKEEEQSEYVYVHASCARLLSPFFFSGGNTECIQSANIYIIIENGKLCVFYGTFCVYSKAFSFQFRPFAAVCLFCCWSPAWPI